MGTHFSACEQVKRWVFAMCAMALSVLLAVSLIPVAAFADDVSDAQTALDAAEAQMKIISEEYDKINAELTSIQGQIDATAADALDAQQSVISGRETLSNAARSEYRSPSAGSMLMLILGSASFDELTRNVVYAGSILQAQADEVEAQKDRVATLEGITAELNTQKDSQTRALSELEKTKQEAAAVVSQAQSQLQNAKDAEADRLAALQAQVANMSNSDSSDQGAGGSSTQVSDKANTTDRQEVVPDSTPVEPNPEPAPDSDAGWKTGIASAYGGSTDPYTPNPGTTATGDVCDDYSMGVAIPMAWPNFSSYFGRTVQISYDGMTVYAVINDCGGMGGGSRSLDLQPGVWKAFGYSSCDDWGLRTVSYRIL